jgi:hypothetical protein
MTRAARYSSSASAVVVAGVDVVGNVGSVASSREARGELTEAEELNGAADFFVEDFDGPVDAALAAGRQPVQVGPSDPGGAPRARGRR